jgi:hypothetical protein
MARHITKQNKKIGGKDLPRLALFLSRFLFFKNDSKSSYLFFQSVLVRTLYHSYKKKSRENW